MATSITSLLKGAQARQKQIQAQEDALADYNWRASAQTADDFSAYLAHYQNRIGKATDPSAQLTYQGKVLSAQRAYTSQELERRSIDVLEGNGTLEDKYATTVGLYNYAVSTGDYNTAQSLRLRADSIQQQIYNKQQTEQSLARSMASRNVVTADQMINSYLYGSPDGTKGVLDNSAPSLRLLNETVQKRGVTLSNKIGEAVAGQYGGPQANYWDAATSLINEMLQNLQYYASVTPDAESANKILSKYNEIVNDDKKFKLLGKDMTLSQMNQARDAQAMGNPLYVVDNEGKLQETKQVGYAWAQSPDGTPYIIPRTYGTAGSEFKGKDYKVWDSEKQNWVTLNATIDGKKEKGTPDNLLRAAGFQVSASDGKYSILQDNQHNFNIPGMDLNVPVTAYLDEFGNLKFTQKDPSGQGNDRIYRVSFDVNGNPIVSNYDKTSQQLISSLTAPTVESPDSFAAKFVRDATTINQVSLLQHTINTSDVLQNAQQIQNSINSIQKVSTVPLQGLAQNINQLSAPANAKVTVSAAPALKPAAIKVNTAPTPGTVKVNTAPAKATVKVNSTPSQSTGSVLQGGTIQGGGYNPYGAVKLQ